MGIRTILISGGAMAYGIYNGREALCKGVLSMCGDGVFAYFPIEYLGICFSYRLIFRRQLYAVLKDERLISRRLFECFVCFAHRPL